MRSQKIPSLKWWAEGRNLLWRKREGETPEAGDKPGQAQFLGMNVCENV